jgi:hypothetical protein
MGHDLSLQLGVLQTPLPTQGKHTSACAFHWKSVISMWCSASVGPSDMGIGHKAVVGTTPQVLGTYLVDCIGVVSLITS